MGDKRLDMKILCAIFGHLDRPHYHKATDVASCNGGCEKHISVHYVEACKRCGEGEQYTYKVEVESFKDIVGSTGVS